VILDICISFERTMLVAEQFLKVLIKKYGKHSISTNDGGTWYPQACKFLKIKHHLHSYYEKSIVERTIQYLKDRTQNVLMIIIFSAEENITVNWNILYIG
jgi:putative transposase